MDSLFPEEEAPVASRAKSPLAERMRPRTFDEFVDQPGPHAHRLTR